MNDSQRRIQACLDACRNFSTEDLEKIGLGPYGAAFSTNKGDNDGVRLIALERVLEKGWTAEHDDRHKDKSIADASKLIIQDYVIDDYDSDIGHTTATYWPIELANHVQRKYRDDNIRRLTIAGALIAAEIDRLRRLAPAPAQPTAKGAT